jgi:hypothetical protein
MTGDIHVRALLLTPGHGHHESGIDDRLSAAGLNSHGRGGSDYYRTTVAAGDS